MDVSDEVKMRAFARSGGRCECQRAAHSHPAGRCTNIISLDKAHYLPVGGEVIADENNLEVLCRYCVISLEAGNHHDA